MCDVTRTYLPAAIYLMLDRVTHKPNQKVVGGLPDLMYYIT